MDEVIVVKFPFPVTEIRVVDEFVYLVDKDGGEVPGDDCGLDTVYDLAFALGVD